MAVHFTKGRVEYGLDNPMERAIVVECRCGHIIKCMRTFHYAGERISFFKVRCAACGEQYLPARQDGSIWKTIESRPVLPLNRPPRRPRLTADRTRLMRRRARHGQIHIGVVWADQSFFSAQPQTVPLTGVKR